MNYYFFLLFFFSEDKANVCMGKEWYRFPSNFFLPSNNWNVKFIKSEFKGQLPQPYLTEKAHATAIERPNFNNLNLEELDRYVKVKCPVCLCYEIVVLQLNKYETAPNLIQLSQNLTSDCLLI